MADLLQIGTSGINAFQRMLATTGNNISNINTEGYTRQRNIAVSEQFNAGVARVVDRRVLDQFAQAEMRRDTSVNAYAQAMSFELQRTDAMMSDKANNLGSAFDATFQSVHTANDDPTSLDTRQLMLGELKALVSTYNMLAKNYSEQQKTVNNEIGTEVSEINALVRNLGELNKEVMQANNLPGGASGALLDHRDEAVRLLAEKVDITVIDGESGSVQVMLRNGDPLVTGIEYSQFSLVPGNPDGRKSDLQYSIAGVSVGINGTTAGGKLGALFDFRDDEISKVRNSMGQLAVAITDAFNTQNRLGMDLDGNIGGDIFKLPITTSHNYANNSDPAKGITSSFLAGFGSSVTAGDYEVIMTGANTFEVYALENNQRTQIPASEITGTFPNIEIESHGLKFDFDPPPYVAGDKFLIQPTLDAADLIDISMVRPEELALASPIRVDASATNTSKAKIELEGITATDTYAFDTVAGTGLLPAAPQQVVINTSSGNTVYEIYDGNSPPNLLGSVTSPPGTGENLLANATPAIADPGYEISVAGVPLHGETFSIAFNNNGFADNSNGLKMADLQNQSLMRKNVIATGDNLMTFHEGFSRMQSSIGERTGNAIVAAQASQAKLDQSTNWHESVSGVNLDEEASNLLKFQQSYSAAAQIVSAARSTFDTLLNSVR
ncbi:flagellar hook-associated protein FlgK [Motilimonas eburnea]|uniref:flagellar hook-associated protein FlgK n=1 Tax=Motilimonas eburnea TaxID=1737488 RepID=UPI001E5EC20A|nr:flagellar hook-associated protein FlgK [Motilimonas eburnea]MCE2571554.1 flagellar hook-associated protein FlgK [Motilimonas eburnea]